MKYLLLALLIGVGVMGCKTQQKLNYFSYEKFNAEVQENEKYRDTCKEPNVWIPSISHSAFYWVGGCMTKEQADTLYLTFRKMACGETSSAMFDGEGNGSSRNETWIDSTSECIVTYSKYVNGKKYASTEREYYRGWTRYLSNKEDSIDHLRSFFQHLIY